MTRQREHCLLVIHPELDQQRALVDVLRPLGREIITSVDLRTAATANANHRVGVVIARDIRVPMERQDVVEGIRHETLRIPVVVLVDELMREKCEKASKLLAGENDFLVWPEDGHLLPGIVRTYLRLVESVELDEANGFVDELRRTGFAAQKREVVRALHLTDGNISQAAQILGLSRGGMQHRMRKFGIPTGGATRSAGE